MTRHTDYTNDIFADYTDADDFLSLNEDSNDYWEGDYPNEYAQYQRDEYGNPILPVRIKKTVPGYQGRYKTWESEYRKQVKQLCLNINKEITYMSDYFTRILDRHYGLGLSPAATGIVRVLKSRAQEAERIANQWEADDYIIPEDDLWAIESIGKEINDRARGIEREMLDKKAHDFFWPASGLLRAVKRGERLLIGPLKPNDRTTDIPAKFNYGGGNTENGPAGMGR